MVSTENVRKLMEMAQDASGCGDDGAGQAYADTANCLKELLAFREGYDPAKQPPEAGKMVLVSGNDGDLVAASLRVWTDTGVRIWQGRGWSAPFEYAVRWYPLPGGA